MIVIKCADFLKDMKGVDTPTTVGTFLSEVMWNSRENQARSYVLAKKFSTEESVDLKAEDVVFIKKIMQTLGARAGEAGQVLVMLGETGDK